ncbi:MAG: hypothetical protein WA021_03635 [Minisyncoccia bacterium]
MAIPTWRLFGVVTFALFLVCLSANSVHAGFGITPPYVENHRLTRGTVYEQKITLVRSDPTEDLQAEITMNLPEIESWFSVDRGNKFILPKGSTQIPIVVRVTVPDDADYEAHQGTIRIRTSALEGSAPSGSGVTIALGAQVDVNVEVVDKIYDFEVRKIRSLDLEEGRRKWGLFFPGKISFLMTIENTGNTEYGPTKVQFEIYDRDMETLLETIENTNRIEKIPPFAIQEVLAELPTRLVAGQYKAKYTIFKGDEVAQQNVIDLSISTIGAIPGYEGYGFNGLSLADKLKVAAALGVPLLILGALGVTLVRRRQRAHALRSY